MTKKKILIVDDDKSVRFTLKKLFEKNGYEVELAVSGNDGFKKYKNGMKEFPVILSDYYMDDGDGLELLENIKKINNDALVIMITAHGSEEVSTDIMKKGAHDYINKPFKNDEFLIKVKQAFELYTLRRENILLKNEKKKKIKNSEIIGISEKMVELIEKIKKVSISETTVLINGESGTGKELIARAIHNGSSRNDKPFIALNCAAIHKDLIENELFGHEKGAYTGATSEHKGRFELADGGTIFLDEIGDMPLSTQAKVLRAIQEKTIERVGGNKVIEVDVRILAATHKNLETLVKENLFREDLYYRLNVIKLYIPPLRERVEDIPLLINYFSKKFNEKLGRWIKGFTSEAMDIFKAYSWPGNIRELQNAVERVTILSEKSIIDREEVEKFAELSTVTKNIDNILVKKTTEKIYSNLFELNFKEAKKKIIEEFEREYITEALKKHNGNISKTSTEIKVHRTFLHEKIKEFNIDIENIKKELKNGK